MTPQNLPTITAGAHAMKSTATCSRLLARAGLDEMLQGEGRFTLFAPTDAAFDQLPAEVMAALESDPAKLRAVLEYHILCVARHLSEMRNGKHATLEGTLLTSSVTDDGVRLDHANTSGEPLRCRNGVIHQIDAVLFPGLEQPKPSTKGQEDSPWAGHRRAPRNSGTVASRAAKAAEALFQPPSPPPASDSI